MKEETFKAVGTLKLMLECIRKAPAPLGRWYLVNGDGFNHYFTSLDKTASMCCWNCSISFRQRRSASRGAAWSGMPTAGGARTGTGCVSVRGAMPIMMCLMIGSKAGCIILLTTVCGI